MWEIKGLEETDLPRVADLELAIFPDCVESSGTAGESASEEPDLVWRDLVRGVVESGMSSFIIVLDEGEICPDAVDPAFRRKGAAARLLLAVEEFLRREGN